MKDERVRKKDIICSIEKFKKSQDKYSIEFQILRDYIFPFLSTELFISFIEYSYSIITNYSN